MASRALSSEGAEMEWMRGSPARDHLSGVIRQLIEDLGVTQEFDRRISKLHSLFTSATRTSGEETRKISGQSSVQHDNILSCQTIRQSRAHLSPDTCCCSCNQAVAAAVVQ
jgi:hypothetical protein